MDDQQEQLVAHYYVYAHQAILDGPARCLVYKTTSPFAAQSFVSDYNREELNSALRLADPQHVIGLEIRTFWYPRAADEVE